MFFQIIRPTVDPVLGVQDFLLPFYLLLLAIVLFWLNTKINRSGLSKVVSFIGGWLAIIFSVIFAVIKLV